jgi:hypothetical protein
LTEVFVVGFLLIAGQTVLWVSRYFMPHVAVNGFSGSILGRPVLRKDDREIIWCIFNTGESLEPFHFRGKIATLVVPYSQMNKAGRNYVGRTFVRRTPWKNLPHVVKTYLTNHSKDFNTDNIYFGVADEEFLHKNPDVENYEAYIEQLNRQINLRNDLLEGRNDELVEMKKFAEEMSGTKRRFFGLLPGKNDEE